MRRIHGIVLLGLVAIGCSGDDGDNSGTTTNATSGTSDTSTSETTATTGKQDMGMAGPTCEQFAEFGAEDLMQFDGCDLDLDQLECPAAQLGCTPLPEQFADCMACGTDCVNFPGACPNDTPPSAQCGPYAMGDACCYLWVIDMPC